MKTKGKKTVDGLLVFLLGPTTRFLGTVSPLAQPFAQTVPNFIQ
jgi:hypothetical protein